MAMSAERHRAPEMLAGSPLGVTEAIMLAHGFTIEMLDALVRGGLAMAEQREMRAGRRPIKVVWLTITDIGRWRWPDRDLPRAPLRQPWGHSASRAGPSY
jgi:hypothetical protein